MQWQTVEQNWPAFFEAIEQRWPEVESSELMDIDGDKARFAQYLSEKRELTSSEAREEIDEWLEGAVPSDVRMDDHMDNTNIRQSARHIPTGEDVYSDDREFGDDNQPDAPIQRSN
ncbi:hypothetical protein EKE94_02825 [Mesobaculum littorinae]|uniref:Uncharacterized protein n=1 Tax=Mesobaculum littorinae TaxID=2486419 RepID=A0A438ALT3_9RHOB|nr:hypothetical protein [Mesobaculum littorinae]RVV99632.1 hypothetical protein EKE94_02825 [Mesobaculum littorinae]